MTEKLALLISFSVFISASQDNSHILDIVTPIKIVQKIILEYVNDSELNQSYTQKQQARLTTYAQQLEASPDHEYIQKLLSQLSEQESREVCKIFLHKNKELLDRYVPTGYISLSLGGRAKVMKLPEQSAVQAISIHSGRNLVAFGSHKNFRLLHLDLKGPKLDVHAAGTAMEPITSIAFSHDGSWLLLGYTNGKIMRYDIANLNFILPAGVFLTVGNNDPIRQIACSPDNTCALVGSTDTCAYLISLRHPFLLNWIARLKHNSYVNGVGFSAHGKYCITGSEDKLLTIWRIHKNPITEDVQDISRVSQIVAHSQAINTLSSKKKEQVILTGSDDATAKLWDIQNPEKPEELSVLKGHTEPITCVRFSPCDSFALTASKDGTIRMWNIEELKNPVCLTTFGERDGAIFTADFGADLDYIAAGVWENGVRAWNLKATDFISDLSLEQLIQLIKVLKSTDEQALVNETTKKLLADLPENLQNYLQKIHELRSKFPREITDIITGYIGTSFAYNYQAERVQRQENFGCVIA